MSVFFPYSPDIVISYLSDTFTISLSNLSSFETILLTLLANMLFYIYWGFIIYFSLKLFNRIYERIC